MHNLKKLYLNEKKIGNKGIKSLTKSNLINL